MKKDWFKERGYLHITNRIPLQKRGKTFSYISNPNNIAKHSFTPLIYKEIIQRRYKKTVINGELKRSHKTIKKGKVISNKKVRPILYATHIDANVYTYYTHEVLGKEYEKKLAGNKNLSTCITAYRSIPTENNHGFKNNVHFAKEIFDEIKNRENCVAIAIDIKSFFNNLNHKKLKNQWKNILGVTSLPNDHYNIFKSVTNFSYIKLSDLKRNMFHFDEKQLALNRRQGKHSFFINYKELLDLGITIYKSQPKSKKNKNSKGIPQGLPISALLANIYMLEFDKSIYRNLVEKEKCFYRRYSDDIVIVCDREKAKGVINFIKSEIKKYDLEIATEKTEQTLFKMHTIGNNSRLQSFRIEDGALKYNIPLNYLGFEFYGYQTLIKSKNLASFYRGMKEAVKRKANRAEKLKEKELIDAIPLFKRKLYRLYTYKGVKTRKIKSYTIDLNGNRQEFERRYRGNFIRYAYKSSDILEAPEIKRQIKNHWKIIQDTIKKYEFSNRPQ